MWCGNFLIHGVTASRDPFVLVPEVDSETLLANACESLASASVTLSDFAGLMEGPHRNTLLGIQQVVMLGELAVNRALEPANA
ncbi:DUF6124 family protein [Pseudomonas sp. EL_65y_Pfl2_R96]|uniref:DUF6124 family protein n=1 Tax=Pseudomonas sp. EL_65y_Pfl2_R96 TaxID=3088699 RepID=UPI0030DC6522